MHTKKVSFSSFFTSFQQFDFFELIKLFGSRLTDKPADISLLVELSKKACDYLTQTNSYLLFTDLKTLRFLFVSPTVQLVTGFTQQEFLSGGVPQFVKNYCPADRVNGMKALYKMTDHQKSENLEDKASYQYITVFRFLNKSGYYSWMFNRMMFVAHDNKNNPWVMISIVSSIKLFKKNDWIGINCLKFNYKKGIYENIFSETYEPEYLKILSNTDLKILSLLARGMDNKQIGNELDYAECTIKDYRKKMLKKTWCDNTAELLTFALRNKLIE